MPEKDTKSNELEVQSGSYLGEDDIVRLEDRYGRNQGELGEPTDNPAK